MAGEITLPCLVTLPTGNVTESLLFHLTAQNNLLYQLHKMSATNHGTYTYTYIFYFSNPEHTHKLSTCKNNKKNSGAMAIRRA